MKKLIIVCFAALCATAIFAASPKAGYSDPEEKILKIFHQYFPEVADPSIYKDGNFYIVHFKNDETESSCRAYYDESGNLLETIRYYKGEQLAPFMRTKIESKYKGKNIFMVTEVVNETEHFYKVILEDAKTMLVVHAIPDGSMHIEKKYKKS